MPSQDTSQAARCQIILAMYTLQRISNLEYQNQMMEAKQMKKKTRSQKVSENPRGAGKSKYSLKIAARKREAAKLGLQDIPYPVLAVIETETKEP